MTDDDLADMMLRAWRDMLELGEEAKIVAFSAEAREPSADDIDLAAMRAALAVVREAEGWRPIESAPKAGSKWHPNIGPVVLLGSVFGQRGLAYWMDGVWINLHDHQPLDYWNEMTHWQPVAEAPTDQPLPEDTA